MKTLIFCEHCGKPMKPSTIPNAKGVWYCSCGAIKESNKEVGVAEKITKKKVGKGVIRKEKTASYPHKCKKCGYGQAEVDTLSAFYSDESDISLYKCKKCGHIERETDGTSNAF